MSKNPPVDYQIRVEGHLDASWAKWFDGLQMTRMDDGTTELLGPITDQAALHGILVKIRDMRLLLVAVNRVEPE